MLDIQEEDGDMDLMTEHTKDTSPPLCTYGKGCRNNSIENSGIAEKVVAVVFVWGHF